MNKYYGSLFCIITLFSNTFLFSIRRPQTRSITRQLLLLNVRNKKQYSEKQIARALHSKNTHSLTRMLPHAAARKKMATLISPAMLLDPQSNLLPLLAFNHVDIACRKRTGTILHTACSSQYTANQLHELIATNRLNVNEPASSNGYAPLHTWAHNAVQKNTDSADAYKKLRLLLNAHANPFARNCKGKTPREVLLAEQRNELTYDKPLRNAMMLTLLQAERGNACDTLPATQCCICLDQTIPGQDDIILPCNHVFHAHCIDTWIVHSHAMALTSACPLCRAKSDPHDEIPEVHETLYDFDDDYIVS